MGFTPENIQSILAAFEAGDWQELTIDLGEDHLHLSRRANGVSAAGPAVLPPPVRETTPTEPPLAPAPQPAPGPAAPVPAPAEGAGATVAAPSVGLFWRSPSPGAPPFVDVGSRVGPDDTLAIIEVMKLMSPLKAGVAGVVTAILAENGSAVAKGDALVVIDPEA